VTERLERILASIPQPDAGETPALREVVLAVEVRRLRAELAARCPTCAALSIESVAAHRAHRGPTVAEQATAAATTLAAVKGATMDRMALMGLTLQEVQAWQAETFGDRCPPGARVVKLREEVEEVAEEVAMGAGASRERVAEELADVLFVAVDIARAFNITPGDLADAVRAKLRRNRARVWVQAADGTFKGTKGGG
jgi:NTP pyrophosphatase (non-canonical NTP hydrolase)